MKTGRRLFISLLLLCLLIVPAFAAKSASNTLHVVAHVPENYGVSFPDNAIRFGDFVFEVEIDIETELDIGDKEGRAILSDDTISVGEIVPGFDSFDFTLVYYGNLSQPYRSEIIIDPNVVWVLEGANQVVSVPIEVKLVKSEMCDQDILCVSSREGQAYIEIPPTGPREGVPVLDVDVSWDGGKDMLPGTYSTELKLDMRVV